LAAVEWLGLAPGTSVYLEDECRAVHSKPLDVLKPNLHFSLSLSHILKPLNDTDSAQVYESMPKSRPSGVG